MFWKAEWRTSHIHAERVWWSQVLLYLMRIAVDTLTFLVDDDRYQVCNSSPSIGSLPLVSPIMNQLLGWLCVGRCLYHDPRGQSCWWEGSEWPRWVPACPPGCKFSLLPSNLYPSPFPDFRLSSRCRVTLLAQNGPNSQGHVGPEPYLSYYSNSWIKFSLTYIGDGRNRNMIC